MTWPIGSGRTFLGTYDLYARLGSAFPHILFESCASGGARFVVTLPGQVTLPERTDAEDGEPIYRQIAEQIASRVRGGALPPVLMPPRNPAVHGAL